jgi:hypothetical protein
MSILPLSSGVVSLHNGEMTTSEFPRGTAHDKANEPHIDSRTRRQALRLLLEHARPGLTTLLLIDPDNGHQIVPPYNRAWTRFVTRLRAGTLDRQLARGRPPEANRFLAARAQVLASLSMRIGLAGCLAHVLREARRPPDPRDRRAPLCRSNIVACETEIQQAHDALLTPLPAPARGAATISWLLSDGTGPLYNRHRSNDLRVALRDATAQLNPSHTACEHSQPILQPCSLGLGARR